jgi:hypothetical protein
LVSVSVSVSVLVWFGLVLFFFFFCSVFGCYSLIFVDVGIVNLFQPIITIIIFIY